MGGNRPPPLALAGDIGGKPEYNGPYDRQSDYSSHQWQDCGRRFSQTLASLSVSLGAN